MFSALRSVEQKTGFAFQGLCCCYMVKRPDSGHGYPEPGLRIQELKQPEVRLLLSPGKPSFPRSAANGSYQESVKSSKHRAWTERSDFQGTLK